MRLIKAAILAVAQAILVFLSPLLVVGQCCSGNSSTCETDAPVERAYRCGRWFVAETKHFQICTVSNSDTAARIADRAEKLRRELGSKWLGKTWSAAWTAKCQIVVHPDQRAYISAVGRASERTAGSSLVKVSKGQITERRIDLIDARECTPTALPHELTHILLRDRFLAKEPPRWADEGVASLADSPTKQHQHYEDLQRALSHRTTFHAASLMTMEKYPTRDEWPVYYGQSISMVQFLVARKSAAHFVDFIEQATIHGYDTALESCYGIPNVAALNRQWGQHMQARLIGFSRPQAPRRS